MHVHCTMFSWQCSSELLPANVHAEMIMWQCSCDKYVHVPMLGCSSNHHNSQIHIVILHTWRLPDAKWTCNIKSWRCSYDNVHDSSMRHEEAVQSVLHSYFSYILAFCHTFVLHLAILSYCPTILEKLPEIRLKFQISWKICLHQA